MKKLILLGCLSFLAGCASFGEPAATQDSTPPPGYSPVYIHTSAPMPASPKVKPAFYLSRVEANSASRIKLFAHLADSNGAYLSGAAKNRGLWCKVLDFSGGSSKDIKDFKLREVTDGDRTPTAIALVMDHSGSMGDSRALTVQEAAAKFIEKKKPEDAIALIKYDDKIGVESPLIQDQAILRSRLQKNGLRGYGGLTAIGDGIARGIEQVANAVGYERKAVLVFTDGLDNSSSIMRDSVINLARRTNTIICCVDFGMNTDADYLQTIANNAGGSYHKAYGSQEFDDIFEDVYHRLKNFYLIEYAPRDYGNHVVTLKLCLPKDTLIAERSFNNTPTIGSISLVDVQFDLNKAEITTASKAAVENIVYLMKAYPTMTIELRGHTDNLNSTGDPDYNQKLSQKRADAVRGAVMQMGITPARIAATGYGDRMPVADNGTEDGRARNRRTEFIITSR